MSDLKAKSASPISILEVFETPLWSVKTEYEREAKLLKEELLNDGIDTIGGQRVKDMAPMKVWRQVARYDELKCRLTPHRDRIERIATAYDDDPSSVSVGDFALGWEGFDHLDKIMSPVPDLAGTALVHRSFFDP